MSTTRIIVSCVAMLLLIGSEWVAAQSRPSRRDRSERRAERDVGDRNESDRNAGERNNAETRPTTDPAGQPSAAARGATAPGRTDRREDGFNVLLQRSIFARTGAAAPTGRPAATTSTAPAAPVLSPEQSVLFVGVLAQDEEYVAFAENRTTNQLMILRAGDNVAGGKVVAITLDTIAYGTVGSIKEIHLGQNLAGEVVSSSYTATGSTTAPAGAAPSTAGLTPAQAAALERMRARSRQERGG